MMTPKALLLVIISIQYAGVASFVAPCTPSSRAVFAIKSTGAPKLMHGDDGGIEDVVGGDGASDLIDRGEIDFPRSKRRSFISSFATSALLGLPASPAYAQKARQNMIWNIICVIFCESESLGYHIHLVFILICICICVCISKAWVTNRKETSRYQTLRHRIRLVP